MCYQVTQMIAGYNIATVKQFGCLVHSMNSSTGLSIIKLLCVEGIQTFAEASHSNDDIVIVEKRTVIC